MPIMILFAFVALALITPTLIHGIQQNNQEIIGTVTARQLHQVTQGAQGYITAYASTIEGASSPTSPATITIPMLEATGFLPQGFQATNPYGQDWEVQVLQPNPGQLQALVLSVGGQPIPPVDVPRIGAEAGSKGGTVTSVGTAQGSFAGWQVSLANYTDPGAGHLAALLYFDNGNLENDYLYRVSVPGQPQLNTMSTDLNMGNNNVTNANNIQANTAQLASGTPNGQPGALQIGSDYLYGDATSMAVRTPGGFYIQNQNGTGAADLSEVNNVYANGTVQAGNDLELGTAGGTASQGSVCSPNGAIAANANGSGQLLVCNGGTWQPPAASSGGKIAQSQFANTFTGTTSSMKYNFVRGYPYFGCWWVTGSLTVTSANNGTITYPMFNGYQGAVTNCYSGCSIPMGGGVNLTIAATGVLVSEASSSNNFGIAHGTVSCPAVTDEAYWQ
ncbi:MAG: shufflon system plasmid conjugative transfer pilus tip adhesin PilV [Acidiferrobacterales bacterium]